MKVPFFELRDFPEGQRQAEEYALIEAFRSKQLILGPQVEAFEQEFSAFLGSKHVVGVGNGYDAIWLSLRVAGIGKGDEVILPANGYIAAANAVVAVGASIVFAEPEPATNGLGVEAVSARVTAKTKAILPVHLYGQVGNMPALQLLAEEQNLMLIEDFAQAQGAVYNGKQAGTFGLLGATSFYPTKNLGAAGDAGAICTDNDELAIQLRSIRNYGQVSRYHNHYIGINSRLDELQAAVLRCRLLVLNKINDERRRLAAVYLKCLANIEGVSLPALPDNAQHTWHLFVIHTNKRAALADFLQKKEVSTLVHYPIPVYRQPAYAELNCKVGAYPFTDQLAAESLSLPLFPGMTENEQQYVIEQIKAFFTL